MKPPRIQATALIVSLVSLFIAWAAVIWVALQVSSLVLNTLRQIVELAQMG